MAGKLASWDLICCSNLFKKRPSSNFEVSLVEVLGHRDKMMSMRTDGYSAPRGGRSRRLLTFCISLQRWRHAKTLQYVRAHGRAHAIENKHGLT